VKATGSASRASKHLRQLREAGLVRRARGGQKRLYRLEAVEYWRPRSCSNRSGNSGADRLDALGEHLEKEQLMDTQNLCAALGKAIHGEGTTACRSSFAAATTKPGPRCGPR